MKRSLVIALAIFCIACKSNKTASENTSSSEPKIVNGLIQDCPDELIVNAMPGDRPKSKKESQYYIYKGFRKEIKDFDSAWVVKHCQVKTTVVQ